MKTKDKICEPLKTSDIIKKINEKEEKISQNKDLGELNRTKKKKQPTYNYIFNKNIWEYSTENVDISSMQEYILTNL